MDVDADQFAESLSFLRDIIDEADFVSLDIQVTGLCSKSSRPQQISLFDLPSEWYMKTRQSFAAIYSMSDWIVCVFQHQRRIKQLCSPFL